MKWTIKQASEKTGIPVHTLRYYDRAGIVSAKRYENGYRRYDEADIAGLKNMVVMKYSHFSLAEIKAMEELFESDPSADCNEISKRILSAKIAELRQIVDTYQKIIALMEELLQMTYSAEAYQYNAARIDSFISQIFDDIRSGAYSQIQRRPYKMAAIFCFSSTGNSLFAAKKLADKIGGKVRPMNRESVKSDDDVIGFVFPVYFWGLPRRVDRFISDLQISNKNAYVFAVATSGGISFGVLGRVKKLLRAKGIRLRYGMRLRSVSNYLPQYLPKDSDELRQRIDVSLQKAADAVIDRKSSLIAPYAFLNRLIYSFCPKEDSDRHFTVSDACTDCGICQKVCPVNNIAAESVKPEFGHRCEHCLACLHNCPARAIDWKQKTQGKQRYTNAGVSLDELICFYAPEKGES